MLTAVKATALTEAILITTFDLPIKVNAALAVTPEAIAFMLPSPINTAAGR